MNNKIDYNQPIKGLNTDVNPINLESTEAYTYALNARQESEDGNSINLTNESSNELYLSIQGQVIGRVNIIEQGRTIYFIVKEDGTSEIGYVQNDVVETFPVDVPRYDECSGQEVFAKEASKSTAIGKYVSIAKSKCLNFDINHPIHKAEYKVTNKSVEIYWTDNYNPMRWMDLNNPPITNGTLDCNLLKVYPDFEVPSIATTEILDTGSLKAGSYEFFVAYANVKGEELSQYFSVTNPTPIWEPTRSDTYDFDTSKSIKLVISKLDLEFKFISIAVCKIINNTKSYFKVGTYDVVSDVFEYVYTGNDKSEIQLSASDVLFRQAHYDRAGTVASQNRLLMWGNMTSAKRINYQEIASAIHLQWETWRVPYNKFEGYTNGANTTNIRGYMRDEVYAFDIVFFLKSGQYTDRFPIPGRKSNSFDMQPVTNKDALNFRRNPCEQSEGFYRWQVYNTGYVEGTDGRYRPGDDCYIGPYQFGEFSYWESTDTYPNDPSIWGDLAGEPIRHHKFPDNIVTHIHDESKDSNFVHSIFPIGVRVSDQVIYNAIDRSSLSEEDKDNIVGYQIVRADRKSNGSVIAKGLLFNVGKYRQDGNDFYYPNYNYNDLRKDPFISYSKPDDHSGPNDGGMKTSGSTKTVDNSNPASRYTTSTGSYSTVSPNNSYNISIPYTSGSVTGTISCTLYVSLDLTSTVQVVFDTFNAAYTTLTYNPIVLSVGNAFVTFPINTNGNANPPLYVTLIAEVNNAGEPIGMSFDANGSPDVDAAAIVISKNGTITSNATYTSAAYISKNASSDITLLAIQIVQGGSEDLRLDGFKDRETSGRRFTFMSPQTSFAKPNLSGLLKLETVEYGSASAHIIGVDDNPKYTISTEGGIKIAVALACSTLVTFEGGIQGISEVVKTHLTIGNFLPGFMTSLELVKKLVPFRQYGYQYTSIGNYSRFNPVLNEGNKIRSINLAGYLNPGLLSIGDDAPINNFQRESSVYIKTVDTLPYPHEIGGTPVDNSRFTLSSYKGETGFDIEINKKVNRDISSFYASIKLIKPDQYGQINSYETVLTGTPMYLQRGNSVTQSIFGGDTFITRYGDKRKLPFFLSNTVGRADDTDVLYHELGNVGYPTYWMSTAPVDVELDQDKVKKAEVVIRHSNAKFVNILGNLTTGGLRTMLEALGFIYQISLDIIKKLGRINTNLDLYQDKVYFEEGVFYMFAYGIPYFFVESEINTDYRQAGITEDKNFFPNVGTDIPDFWLQEKNVSIAKDNAHLYNRDYSRLNKENIFTSLPVDYDQSKLINYHTTRVIYSQPASLEDNQNNWLVYKANDYYDFPLTNGELIDLNGIESEKVLARFENNTAVYGAYITLDTSNKTAITSSGSMFTNAPQEFTKSSIGYAGTQHKCFVSTKYGHFWIDAKRGEVFQFESNLAEISNQGMRNWFKENLPFRILRSHKVPVDNSYKDIGLSMGWDNRYERLFITKKDFIPLNSSIIYKKGDFYLGDIIVSVHDPKYFCDASWTIAYSPKMKSWVSFYSFVPDYYTSQGDFFQTGYRHSVYNHLHSNRSFQTYYDITYPFEIESITKPDIQNSVLNAISYKMDVLRYTNEYDWKLINGVTFDTAEIRSTQQTTGLLELNVRDKNDMSTGMENVINDESITIPVTSTDDTWKFNKFSDVTLDANSSIPLNLYECNNVGRSVNPNAVDYTKTNDMLRRTRLKSDWFKVRLSSVRNTRFKKIFKWLITKQTKSVR
jgi:hypothetical protein